MNERKKERKEGRKEERKEERSTKMSEVSLIIKFVTLRSDVDVWFYALHTRMK